MWSRRCYRLAHSVIRGYINSSRIPRAFSPNTHAVILYAGEMCEYTIEEREMIISIPDSIWQAAKMAIRNTVIDDELIRLRARSEEHRFHKDPIWFFSAAEMALYRDKLQQRRKTEC